MGNFFEYKENSQIMRTYEIAMENIFSMEIDTFFIKVTKQIAFVGPTVFHFIGIHI